MEQDITDRLELILKEYGMSPSGFSDKLQIQRSAMSHIFSRRNRPSLDVIQKVLKCFPEVNSNWLLTGLGKMKQLNLFGEDDAQELSKKNVEQPVPSIQGDPLLKMESQVIVPTDEPPGFNEKKSMPTRMSDPYIYNLPEEKIDFTSMNFPLEEKKVAEPRREYTAQEKFVEEQIVPSHQTSDADGSGSFGRSFTQEKRAAEKKEKEIARIVIFYTDKTFSVHLPE